MGLHSRGPLASGEKNRPSLSEQINYIPRARDGNRVNAARHAAARAKARAPRHRAACAKVAPAPDLGLRAGGAGSPVRPAWRAARITLNTPNAAGASASGVGAVDGTSPAALMPPADRVSAHSQVGVCSDVNNRTSEHPNGRIVVLKFQLKFTPSSSTSGLIVQDVSMIAALFDLM
jgi:hypothetical protein